MKTGRGVLTDKVRFEAMAQLGRDITQAELRLMPYIQFCMMNGQILNTNRINKGERAVLQQWRDEGHVEGGASGLSITKDFWDSINQILWLAYAAHREK